MSALSKPKEKAPSGPRIHRHSQRPGQVEETAATPITSTKFHINPSSSNIVTQTPTVFAALRQVGTPQVLNQITVYGIDTGMEKGNRKITVRVPAALLRSAQAETGKGVTETVRKGLELLRRANAYRKMQQMRGKVKFGMSLDELRRDD